MEPPSTQITAKPRSHLKAASKPPLAGAAGLKPAPGLRSRQVPAHFHITPLVSHRHLCPPGPRRPRAGSEAPQPGFLCEATHPRPPRSIPELPPSPPHPRPGLTGAGAVGAAGGQRQERQQQQEQRRRRAGSPRHGRPALSRHRRPPPAPQRHRRRRRRRRFRRLPRPAPPPAEPPPPEQPLGRARGPVG